MAPFATIALLLTVAAGAVLASFLWKRKFAPWPHSVAHALVGLVGLMMLTVAVLTENDQPILSYSLAALLAALLTGVLLVAFHLRGKLAPKRWVLVHAGVAVTGVAVLLSHVSGLV